MCVPLLCLFPFLLCFVLFVFWVASSVSCFVVCLLVSVLVPPFCYLYSSCSLSRFVCDPHLNMSMSM